MSLYLSKELEGKVDLENHNSSSDYAIITKEYSVDFKFLSLHNKKNNIFLFLETKKDFLKLFFSNSEFDIMLQNQEFKNLNQKNVVSIKNSNDIFAVLLKIKK